MLTIFRIKGGKSWTVRLNNKPLHAFPTRREAKQFIEQMNKKYGELL